jgi:hypothetical protein
MRKKCYIIILLFCFISFGNLFSQNKVKKDSIQFFNLIEAGLNYSFHGGLKQPLNNFGFGIDALHVFRKGKRLNILAGVGLSVLDCYYNYIPGDLSSSKTHPYHYENQQNTSLNVVVPFYWRVNFGKKTRFFVFQGISVLIGVIGQRKGIYVKDYYNDTQTPYKYVGTSGIMGGFSFGWGLTIPLKKHKLTIRNCWSLYFSRSLIESRLKIPYTVSSLSVGIQF